VYYDQTFKFREMIYTKFNIHANRKRHFKLSDVVLESIGPHHIIYPGQFNFQKRSKFLHYCLIVV